MNISANKPCGIILNIQKLLLNSLELASEKSRCSIFLITKVSSINEQFLTVNLKVKFVENGFAEEKVGEHLRSNCKLLPDL